MMYSKDIYSSLTEYIRLISSLTFFSPQSYVSGKAILFILIVYTDYPCLFSLFGSGIRDGPLEKGWGGGWGIFSLPEFFLAHLLCKNFFFGYSPMYDFFFLRKYFPYAQFAIELIKNKATLFYQIHSLYCYVTLHF